MIKIAICDDFKKMTGVIEKMLYENAKRKNIKVSCNVFFEGLTLIENIENGNYYDIIYLEVQMETITGIQVAEKIRNMNIPVLIIYVSSHEKNLKDLFTTEPFRFINKPIDKDEFRNVFLAACERIRHRTEYFSFAYNRTVIKIPLRNICYFESQNRLIKIHVIGTFRKEENLDSDNPKDRFYGKMNDVEKSLSQNNNCFLRIHQSYLINFDYIESINFTEACMHDGTLIQISEDRQKIIRTQFCEMVGMKI